MLRPATSLVWLKRDVDEDLERVHYKCILCRRSLVSRPITTLFHAEQMNMVIRHLDSEEHFHQWELERLAQ